MNRSTGSNGHDPANPGYFEFIPHDPANPVTISRDSPPHLVDLADLELGKEYELVISTYSGLCRYRVGDIAYLLPFQDLFFGTASALFFSLVLHFSIFNFLLYVRPRSKI
ncbi:hypothetical protein L2E82_07026 [Cichorium intybus]|uniref:Uncharacterized protein n=1 Tax=Cichorium intybus TaxID=13427 RepID=A0ACB9G4C8_CICIN|nr:hypothetical protein L2E82_07026 [Cichorium intybus]